MATQILEENRTQREPVQQGDIVVGPLLKPQNSARSAGAGSIHDDNTAQNLGFRGGTVAGSLHMEQFPPVLTRLFGAIEIQHLAGPVLAEHDYRCTSEILAVSETPKTEYIWYESLLSEENGTPVASMLMMLRFMKASSALWQKV